MFSKSADSCASLAFDITAADADLDQSARSLFIGTGGAVKVTTTQPGNATVLAGLATEAGLTVTLDQAQALLDAAVVTDGEPVADIAAAGLMLVAAPEVAA